LKTGLKIYKAVSCISSFCLASTKKTKLLNKFQKLQIAEYQNEIGQEYIILENGRVDVKIISDDSIY